MSKEYIYFEGVRVIEQDNGNHLGIIIGDNCGLKDAEASVSDFNRTVNVVLSRFHFCDPFTRYKLVWDYSKHETELIFTAWRKATRIGL